MEGNPYKKTRHYFFKLKIYLATCNIYVCKNHIELKT